MELSNKVTQSEPTFNGYVIALGASAGGLEALENFFRNCPVDIGAAFVVIQHLSSDHKSIMKDLLSRHTQMSITVVEQGMLLKENHIFLIPPGKVMSMEGDRFLLTSKSPHVLTLPIDIFFNSMSQRFENRCVAVILSGTGSDGSRGAVAVNAAGGFVVAQEPTEAKFDGMPKSVLATEVVDEVLPVDQLAQRIVEHIANPAAQKTHVSPGQLGTPEDEEEAMEGIMTLLFQSGGIDFRDYKSATFLRRVERRVQVRQVSSFSDYFMLLQEDHTELATLRRELLISVTSFFRDEEAFDALATTVIPELVANADAHSMIRVWSAATSTGEEAYSLAMLFIEEFDRARRWPQLKIFATDVNQHVIELAAAGQYTQAVAAELSVQRLERFFYKTGNSFTVKPELRQCIVFAKHNLLSDPPFTRMDLVTCRNALIYFKPEAQLRAMHRLQYAIRPGGVLFLGSSESINCVAKGFEEINPKLKLFRRNDKALPFVIEGNSLHATRLSSEGGYRGNPAVRSVMGASRELSVLDKSTSVLLDLYAPPSILVNDNHQAVHFFGDLQPFFKVRSGAVSTQINRILPESLVPVAQALLYKASKDWKTLQSDCIHFACAHEGPYRQVRLTVKPVMIDANERLLLLCFESPVVHQTSTLELSGSIDVGAETTARIDALQNELGATRESLQATIEELETSNEELQATNEELMASNEELQSSNEELQSVNEELNTVNAEYQEKVMLLNRLNVDLDTMAKAVGVATVFVDEHLIITRFSPAAVSIFKLREGDVGRPLEEISHRLKHPDIMADFALTLASEQTLEKEVLSEEGSAYLMRVMFYKVPSSAARGVVATFVDISAFQDAERLQSIMDALPEHIAVLEQDGTIAMVNASWKRFANANSEPTLLTTSTGSNYLNVCRKLQQNSKDKTVARAYQGVKGVLEGSIPMFQMIYQCHSPNEKRWFVMNVGLIKGNLELGAVVSHTNISELHQND
ncbi:CheR family methyltransferase [Nitrincola tibetensis]|uniref:CheR family methyltransferase n=1 Tax=Nitrincola tibetensis TaxID=2219697 RepID=UPI001960C6C0|nr:CheR family methyltransferase [Nitrincola tibetensis]